MFLILARAMTEPHVSCNSAAFNREAFMEKMETLRGGSACCTRKCNRLVCGKNSVSRQADVLEHLRLEKGKRQSESRRLPTGKRIRKKR